MNPSIRLLAIATVLSVAGTTLQAQGPGDFNLPDLGDASHQVMSPSDQKRLGADFYRQAQQTMDIVDDPELNEYIKTLGNRLVTSIGLPDGSFTFFLVNNNTVNAFAVPGGYIGIHTGLILTARDEAEVASVLGHETAHVTQQHIPRMYAEQKENLLPNLATLLAGILIGGQATEAAIAISTARSVSDQLTYTRSFEREADRIGIGILASSGYDTNAMATFFGRMQQATAIYETGAPQFLQTHPVTTDRIAEAKARAAAYPPASIRDDAPFRHMQARLRVMSMEPAAAVSHFRDQLRRSETASDADRYGLAYALLASGEYREANKQIDELLREQSANPLYLTLQARIASRAGDTGRALQLYQDIYQRDEDSLSAISYYSEELIRQGQYQQARKVLRKAVRKHPSEIGFYRMLARAEQESGSMAESHRANAEAYYLAGDLPSAIRQLKIAQSLADKDNFYIQSSISARLKEIEFKQAQNKKK
jgi:predicted Zn-dependent protease